MEQIFIKKRGARQGWKGGSNTVVCVYVYLFIYVGQEQNVLKVKYRKKNGTSSMLNSYHPLSRDKSIEQKTAGVSKGLVIGQVVDLKKEC